MSTEANTINGTAPEGQITNLKTAKKKASKAASSKLKAKNSSKVSPTTQKTKRAKAPKSERLMKT